VAPLNQTAGVVELRNHIAMHQSHNIPWHLISSNFEFKENDKSFTPPFLGLVSKDNPNTLQEINHFVRKFAQAIRTFSDTERAKYPDQKLQSEGNVFSDELKKKYPEYLNDANQRIEYWIQSANRKVAIYGTDNGDLADIVKILLYENELPILIMMARHPNIPIARLQEFGYYNVGFSRVMDSALRAYLYFNVAEATNTLTNGKYTYSKEYGDLLKDVATVNYYSAQEIPHHQFLQSCGVYGYEHSYDTCQGFIGINRNRDEGEWSRDLHVHKDFGRLKEYLKTLFALLYRYDLLLRECEIEPRWEWEIAGRFPINKVISWASKFYYIFLVDII